MPLSAIFLLYHGEHVSAVTTYLSSNNTKIRLGWFGTGRSQHVIGYLRCP